MSDEPVLQQKTPLDTLCLYLTKKLAYGRKTFSLLVAFISWSDKKLASFFRFCFPYWYIYNQRLFFFTHHKSQFSIQGERQKNKSRHHHYFSWSNKPFSRFRHLCMRFSIDGIKAMSRGFSGGSNWSNLFVLSKRDDDFILEKRTVRVSDNFTSVLLAVRTSTDATAFRQETMITPTHNLPLPSFFIVWCID